MDEIKPKYKIVTMNVGGASGARHLPGHEAFVTWKGIGRLVDVSDSIGLAYQLVHSAWEKVISDLGLGSEISELESRAGALGALVDADCFGLQVDISPQDLLENLLRYPYQAAGLFEETKPVDSNPMMKGESLMHNFDWKQNPLKKYEPGSSINKGVEPATAPIQEVLKKYTNAAAYTSNIRQEVYFSSKKAPQTYLCQPRAHFYRRVGL